MIDSTSFHLSQLRTLPSGFIVKDSNLLERINPQKDSIMESILNRFTNTSELKEFYQTYDIYQSDAINTSYHEYCREASFDNYYKLIDLLYRALSGVEFTQWCMLQFSSNFMTSLSRKSFFNMLENIYHGKDLQRGLIYAPVSLTIDTSNITRAQIDIDKDVKRFNDIRNGLNFSWPDVLFELTKNRTLADFVHVVFAPKANI
jgi:hypothetical protein